MRNVELETLTKPFAVRIIRMFAKLPKTREADVVGTQLLRSATSVAANYREAGRARSRAELISKLGIVEGELAESQLWLELLTDAGIVAQERLAALLQETDELIRIMVASLVTLKRTRPRAPAAQPH